MDGERGCVAAVVPLGLGDSVGAGVGGTRFSLHGGSLFGSDSGVSGKDREPRGGGRYWRTRILIGGYRSHSGGSAIGSWRRISGRGGRKKTARPAPSRVRRPRASAVLEIHCVDFTGPPCGTHSPCLGLLECWVEPGASHARAVTHCFPVQCEDVSHGAGCLMLLEDIPNAPLGKLLEIQLQNR